MANRAGSDTDRLDVPLILGCVSKKRSTPSAARDLYMSPLFERRRRYADRSGRPWVIFSALHGIVDPETVLAPYDVTLKTASPAQKRAMGERVAGQLEDRFGLLDGQPRTLEEVGRVFGVTRERIRQIESKTLSKLRHPSRSGRLRDYIED